MVVSKATTGRPEATADSTSGLTVRELGGRVDPTENHSLHYFIYRSIVEHYSIVELDFSSTGLRAYLLPAICKEP